MGLFRDRSGSPRWSLFSPRPQPRRARGMNSPDSPATPSEPFDEAVADVENEHTTLAQSPTTRERRSARELKASDRYAGLPALSAAEARARNGRGFASIIRHRRSRRHDHEVRHVPVDVSRVESALVDAAAALGRGLVQGSVWDAGTGLALAARGEHGSRSAPVWHRALRDVRSALPEAGLGTAGSQHLVGLEGGDLAILLHVPSGLGACLTIQPDAVSLDDVLDSVVPVLRDALASASGRR